MVARTLKTSLAAFLSATTLASCTVTGIKKEPETPRVATKVEYATTRPNYLDSLPSVESIKKMNPEEIFFEYFNQMTYAFNEEIIPYTTFTNNVPKVKFVIDGKEVTLELPFYREEGSFLRYLKDGKLTPKSMIVNDLKATLEESVNNAYALFLKTPMQVNKRKDKIFGPHAGKLKNEHIAGTSLTFGDLYDYMTIEKKDFVPKRLIFAPAEDYLAATMLEKGEIIYTPLARILDELAGRNSTLAHELIHNNPKLQSFPLAFTSNFELYAFLSDLNNEPTPLLSVVLHPYGRSLRELTKDYLDVDLIKEIRGSINSRFDVYLDMDAKKLADLRERASVIAAIFEPIIREEAYPEELSFPYWWMAAEDYTRNGNLSFEVATAKTLMPAMLAKDGVKKLFNEKKDVLEKVIASTMKTYTPPSMGTFGPFVIMTGPDFKTLLVKNAERAGLSNAEAKFAYHYFLYTELLNEDGSINYSWLPVNAMKSSLQSITSDFRSATEEEFKKEKGYDLESFKKKAEILDWVNKRLATAENYRKIGDLTGVEYSEKFDARLLDPRWDMDEVYEGILPKNVSKLGSKAMKSETALKVKDGLEVLVRRYDTMKGLGFADGVDVVTVTIKNDGKLAPKPSLVYYAQDADDAMVNGVMVVDTDNVGTLGYNDFDYAKYVITDNLSDAEAELLEAMRDVDVKKAESKDKKSEEKKTSTKLILPSAGSFALVDTDGNEVNDSLEVMSRNGEDVILSYYKIEDTKSGDAGIANSLVADDLGIFQVTKKGLKKISFNDVTKGKPFLVRVLSGEKVKTYVDENLDGIFDWEL